MNTTKNKFNFSWSLSRVQQSNLEKRFNGIASVKKTRKGFSITINEDKFSSGIELNSFRGALADLKASYRKEINVARTSIIKQGLKLGALSVATGAVAAPILSMEGLGALLTAGVTMSAAIPAVGWIIGGSVLATTIIVSGIGVFVYAAEKNRIKEQFLSEMSDLNHKSILFMDTSSVDVNRLENTLKRSQSETSLGLSLNKVIKYGAMFRSVSDSVLKQSGDSIESNTLKLF
jgi:hypothetical protein